MISFSNYVEIEHVLNNHIGISVYYYIDLNPVCTVEQLISIILCKHARHVLSRKHTALIKRRLKECEVEVLSTDVAKPKKIHSQTFWRGIQHFTKLTRCLQRWINRNA